MCVMPALVYGQLRAWFGVQLRLYVFFLQYVYAYRGVFFLDFLPEIDLYVCACAHAMR